MAQLLKDTISTKSDDDLYRMIDSGWNVTIAKVELASRKLPLVKPKVKRVKGTPSFHAKRRCGVTGGHVDLSTITKLGRPTLHGQRLDPWNR